VVVEEEKKEEVKPRVNKMKACRIESKPLKEVQEHLEQRYESDYLFLRLVNGRNAYNIPKCELLSRVDRQRSADEALS